MCTKILSFLLSSEASSFPLSLYLSVSTCVVFLYLLFNIVLLQAWRYLQGSAGHCLGAKPLTLHPQLGSPAPPCTRWECHAKGRGGEVEPGIPLPMTSPPQSRADLQSPRLIGLQPPPVKRHWIPGWGRLRDLLHWIAYQMSCGVPASWWQGQLSTHPISRSHRS